MKVALREKNPAILKFAKHTYGIYAGKKYKLSLEDENLLDDIDGKCLLLSNHCHLLDPVFISLLFPFHVRWVTGAYLFKLKLLGSLLEKQARCIAKQQGRSDLSTINEMKKAFQNEECVGLFPEGCRTWDGDFNPLDNAATAKLVRIFKVPVIFINLEGAFARKPRWSNVDRKGPIAVKVKRVLYPEEFKHMKIGEINDIINEELGFSHDAYEDKNHIPYKCNHQVEGLQKILYICPSCGAIDTLDTSGKTAVCTQCSCETEMDDYFKIKSTSHNFKTLHQWREWEKKQLIDVDRFKEEPGVLLQTLRDGKMVVLSKKIKVRMENHAIIVSYDDKKLILDFDSITSLILNAKQSIELYHNGTQYRIRLGADGCSLKFFDYFESYEIIKENLSNGI
ncbi:MAG: 1-acyl-sn-glycerol-3-phosphate acyltransferase [Sphaerochaetaceae bacterium]|nr:1-acyl-sn-glycerol-3-phosphate acyltransferase [Sphaerochaetaceae bacterium]